MSFDKWKERRVPTGQPAQDERRNNKWLGFHGGGKTSEKCWVNKQGGMSSRIIFEMRE